MFKHRHLYNVNKQNASTASPYQQTQCIEEDGRRPEINENLSRLPLNRDDGDRQVVDVAEIARLMKENPPCAEDGESSGVVVEDNMIMEYWSDDEVALLM
jgi:hypothetical protein